MNSYAILGQGKNLKKVGNEIVLSLAKNNNISKYRIIGNIIFLECMNKVNSERILGKRTFNAIISSSSQDDIYNSIKALIKGKKEVGNFAIRVLRKGEHSYDSTGLARDIAGAAFDVWKNISVNLDEPELEIVVQIINKIGIIYLKYK